MSDPSKGLTPTPPEAEPENKPQVFQAATAMFSVPSQVAQQAAAAGEAPTDLAAAPDRVWHVVIGAAQEGPLTLEQLAQKLHTGAIDAKALVWRPTMASWAALDEVPDLQELASAAPAPSATVAPMQQSGALSPEAGAALTALMAADLQDMVRDGREPARDTAPAPQAPEPVSNLLGADLFGNSATAFLQVPTSPSEAPQASPVQAAAPAPQAAPTAHAAQPRPMAAAPKTNRPLWHWAAVSAAVGALLTGGYWLTRPAPEAPQAPVVAPPVPAAKAPVDALPAAPAPAGVAPPSAVPAAPEPAAPDAALAAPRDTAPAKAAVKSKADTEPAGKNNSHRRNRGHRRGRHHSH